MPELNEVNMARFSGPFCGITPTQSLLPPFDRYTVRIGAHVVTGLVLPEQTARALEELPLGAPVCLATGRIGAGRIGLALRVRDRLHRARWQDFVWATGFVVPTLGLGLFALFFAALGAQPALLPAITALIAIPALAVFQIVANTRAWLTGR